MIRVSIVAGLLDAMLVLGVCATPPGNEACSAADANSLRRHVSSERRRIAGDPGLCDRGARFSMR